MTVHLFHRGVGHQAGELVPPRQAHGRRSVVQRHLVPRSGRRDHQLQRQELVLRRPAPQKPEPFDLLADESRLLLPVRQLEETHSERQKLLAGFVLQFKI